LAAASCSLEWAVDVALARSVPQLPTGPSWAYEIKVRVMRTLVPDAKVPAPVRDPDWFANRSQGEHE
jgi:hypothetical protein